MSSKHKKVSYLNGKGDRVTYLISQALQSDNDELIKRLNYARQVLEFSMKRDHGDGRASLGTARASSGNQRPLPGQERQVLQTAR